MIRYKCKDCGAKGTEYEIYDYGSIRLCALCIDNQVTSESQRERNEERLCAIQDTKLAILSQLRRWHAQGLQLPTAIQKLDAALD